MEKTTIPNGAILISRLLLESDIFFRKPPEWLKIWIYILLRVNHTATKQFRRGEGYFNWNKETANLKGLSSNQWHECVSWLKRAKQITTHKTTRGNIIFVLNYEKYQTLKNYKTDTETDTETEAQPKHNRSTTDTICKNDNNDKNEKKGLFVPPSLSELKEYIALNEYNVDAAQWLSFYESKGWMIGKSKMKDWQAAVRTWAIRNKNLPKIGSREQEARQMVEQCRAKFGNDAEEAAMFKFSAKYGNEEMLKYKGIFHL